MLRLTKIFLIAIVFFAGTLVPQVTEAATLRIEVREPDGGGGAPKPVPGVTVEVTNLGTGKTTKAKTDKRGRARFRKLPGGKYRIVVSNWTGKTWRYRWYYRDLKRKGFAKIGVPLGDSVPDATFPQTIGEYALAAIKKGNRSKATKSLADLKKWLKHHGQALFDLNRFFSAVRDKLLAQLPKRLRTRLQGRLSRTKPDGQYAIVAKELGRVQAERREVVRQIVESKRNKYLNDLRTAYDRLGVLESKLLKLHTLYYDEQRHRRFVEKARQAIEKINRALNAPKPASKPASKPKPKSTSQAPGGGYGDSEGASCFTAGTKVLMANGTEKPIEAVRIGDSVRGKDGAVNKVTGIERPNLDKRLLYAINGGRAFVTAEHPFWTEGGWKSIDPSATLAENPRLMVGALAVGARVAMILPSAGRKLAAAGGGARFVNYAPTTKLQTIAISSILGVTGDPKMRVYNLLLDGNHTYFADGYLVHNKG